MRRLAALFGVFGLVAVSAAASLVSTDLSADPEPMSTTARSATFLIPSNDGYGIADCIASQGSCGRRAAETWCETKGYRTALSFGAADRADFTGSVPQRSASGGEMKPLVVTCGR